MGSYENPNVNSQQSTLCTKNSELTNKIRSYEQMYLNFFFSSPA